MKHSGKKDKSRIIGYRFEGDFDETAMEKLLEWAKKEGTVVAFDTGRGHCLWFDGMPGKAMRELRKEVLALMDNPTLWR